MKAKFSQKYLPITFQDQQLDKWSRLAQGTCSEYIEKFDEFLTRCGEFVDESPMVTLSRFRSGLRDDLRRELFVRCVSDLKHVYQIVRDLDASRGSTINEVHIIRARALKPPLDSPSSNSIPTIRP